MDYGIVVDLHVMQAHGLVRCGLPIQVILRNGCYGHVSFLVEIEKPRGWVIGWVRTGETNFEKERFLPIVFLNPLGRAISSEGIRMSLFRLIPGKGSQAIPIVRSFAVENPFLLLHSDFLQMLLPFVLKISSLEKTVFIFDYLSFMEPARGSEWPSVHFPNVRTVIACF
jgi:hypothetical protein